MSIQTLLNTLQDPIKEMGLVRTGLETNVIESFLTKEDIVVKDILKRLDIPASTYFSKKKNHQLLDSHTTEKFVRLISIIKMATDILGKSEAKQWIYRSVPSLGDEAPLNLLDTEVGHRLVEQALLQIKYGMYA